MDGGAQVMEVGGVLLSILMVRGLYGNWVEPASKGKEHELFWEICGGLGCDNEQKILCRKPPTCWDLLANIWCPSTTSELCKHLWKKPIAHLLMKACLPRPTLESVCGSPLLNVQMRQKKVFQFPNIPAQESETLTSYCSICQWASACWLPHLATEGTDFTNHILASVCFLLEISR